ncbi:Putative F-box protein At3g16210 [Linum grandiflorum]
MDGRSKRIRPYTSTGGGSSSSRSSKGCWLPQEIMVEIVKRLPTAASIGRFRCVGKSWYCLLSDPHFIRQNTRLFDDNGTIDDDKKARLTIIWDAGVSAVSLSNDTLEPVSPVLKLGDLITEINLSHPSLEVGGCCDGIFCLYSSSSPYNIILWNPTTSEYRILPLLPPLLGSRQISMTNLGFGYDPLTNDYKVVVLVKFGGGGLNGSDDNKPRSVYLYSLRNNSWKAVCEWGDALIREELFQSRYSSGKSERCDWLSYRQEGDGRSEWYITSFDLSKHVFNTVVLPCLPRGSGACEYKSVSMAHEYLMVITYNPRSQTSYVWSLNYGMLERGEECCWNKLYTVVNCTVMDGDSSYVPAGIWKHAKCFVLDTDRQLHVVDLHSGGQSTLPIKTEYLNICEIRGYIPSPMPLSSRRWANEGCNMGGADVCFMHK